MKKRNTPPRLICYLSVAALSVAGCSQNTTKVKPSASTLSETQPAPSDEGSPSRLFHYSKKGLRQVKIKDTRSTKRVQYEYANLWERLFDNYSLPDVGNQAVEREVSWYINHPNYLLRAQQRAEPFLYNIVQQIERQGVPGELALLPVVESAFQPRAVSPANAAGIWQFIPATGRRYGLRQNHSYDGRRDVYASTRAAIKYLKKLNRQFDGDWLLAIAAYNCGEGAVERAIQRNLYQGLPTDFWSLDLPQETRSYVPRLLAVSRLMADAGRYGIDLMHIPNQARYKPVKVSQQLDLALAADAADMSLEQFKALNPGFKQSFVDPEGSVRLFVPADKSKTFKKELARLASVQSDMLRREFERSRDGGDELLMPGTDTVAASDEPSPTRIAAAEPSAAWATRNASGGQTRDRANISAANENAGAMERPVRAPSTDTPTTYLPSEGSADPFRPSRLAESFEDLEPAVEEADQRRGSRRHGSSRSARSSHGHHVPVHASTVKKNATRGAAKVVLRGPERSHGARRAAKPPVSYRYSEQHGVRTSGSAQQAKGRTGQAKTTLAVRDGTAAKPSKWMLASASAAGTRAGQTSGSRHKGRDSGATSSRNSGKSAESRKGERIVTAKADTPKGKGRR